MTVMKNISSGEDYSLPQFWHLENRNKTRIRLTGDNVWNVTST